MIRNKKRTKKRNRSGDKREILRRIERIRKSEFYKLLPKEMKNELRSLKRLYSKPGRARS